jgi:hypothetical protein
MGNSFDRKVAKIKNKLMPGEHPQNQSATIGIEF